MDSSPLAFFTTPAGRFLALSLPVLLTIGYTLLLIATSVGGTKIVHVGRASFHYVMQSIGIALMTVGALPTLLSVLMGPQYPGRTYMSLLWIFLVGGTLFLWHEQMVSRLERSSVLLVHTIFITVVKTMGYLSALLSILYVLIAVAMGILGPSWWIPPTVFFLYGVLLYWSASGDEDLSTTFRSTPLHVTKKMHHPLKKVQKKARIGFLGLARKKA